MKKSWDITTDSLYHYLSIKDRYIIYGTALDPKTRIELKCTLKEFFKEKNEVFLRIKDNFGDDILMEVIDSVSLMLKEK